MSLMGLGIEAMERGWLPDFVARAAIRRLCRQRLNQERQSHLEGQAPHAEFARSLRSGPIARKPEKANEQHYELPAEFFATLLGPQRKYSCCLWPTEQTNLAQAESAALAVTCERAELADGQRILELGCGWGSLSLWMAEKYPQSSITAVSNSRPQRAFIEAETAARKLRNLRVVTADINRFEPEGLSVAGRKFDRVVSVEMFEHMRNLERLLQRIASWLQPQGKLFVHLFCHRELTYPFENNGAGDWMARQFFAGGMMPISGLLGQFDRDLRVARHWQWNGRHYQRTALAWLHNLDVQRENAMSVLRSVYEPGVARRQFHRWRMFLLAVAELFGFAQGQEWFVSHYLLEPCASAGRIGLDSSLSAAC